jgi:hypothetical protein
MQASSQHTISFHSPAATRSVFWLIATSEAQRFCTYQGQCTEKKSADNTFGNETYKSGRMRKESEWIHGKKKDKFYL